MSATEDIKSRLDIVDIISESVQLRKAGNSYSGFCPFHSNTRTPAFVVFPDSQTWRCFGACADGGDLFSYVMKKEGWEFKEALKNLANRAGVTLEERRPVDKKKKAVEEKLGDLLTAVSIYFHQLFLYAPQAEHARQYMARRGLTAETLADFQIGFALNSWDACRAHFNMQGYSDQDLLDAGLLTENPEKGTRYDRFRNRLMIPIHDGNGRSVGFGARTLEKDGIPKYLNSPQTALFDKSHLLYGFNRARRTIRDARQAVIVEGYMDVMQAWQAGFHNVVAQMGTALTESQLNLLKKVTKQYVIALDADAAGVKATMRGLQVARETLDRDVEISFDARGLVQQEGRLKADIRIVTLPEGKDPDDIIQEDPEVWKRLIADAKPIVAYVIGVATQELDMEDAKEKTAVAQQIIPLINDINSPVERDHYWQLLARSIRIDERSLRQVRTQQKTSYKQRHAAEKSQKKIVVTQTAVAEQVADSLRHLQQQKGISTNNTSATDTGRKEINYLCQCLHYPQIMAAVNQKLSEIEQPIVNENDFSLMEDRALLRQMYHWQAANTVAAKEELWDSLDIALSNRVQYLQSLPQAPDSKLDRLADELAKSVLDWRLKKITAHLSKLKQLFPQKTQTDDSADLYKQQTKVSHEQIRKIHKARGAMSAGNRRRAEDAANGRF